MANDHRMQHRPARPESGAPLFDLTVNEIYPPDVYTGRGHEYVGRSPRDREALSIALLAKGKPSSMVAIYRAVPKSHGKTEIAPGDWVTTVRSYAVEHGRGFEEGATILTRKVPASSLYTEGNSLLEWGYWPGQAAEGRVGSGAPTMTIYWEDLTEEQKAEYRRAREAELLAIGEMTFPAKGVWNGSTPVDVLGPIRRFPPYDDPAYGKPSLKSNAQLMVRNRNTGEKFIAMAYSVFVDGRRLLGKNPPLRDPDAPLRKIFGPEFKSYSFAEIAEAEKKRQGRVAGDLSRWGSFDVWYGDGRKVMVHRDEGDFDRAKAYAKKMLASAPFAMIANASGESYGRRRRTIPVLFAVERGKAPERGESAVKIAKKYLGGRHGDLVVGRFEEPKAPGGWSRQGSSSGRRMGRSAGETPRAGFNPYYEDLVAQGYLAPGRYRIADREVAYVKRREFVTTYAWAIPDERVLQELVAFSPKYVEIGAGGGYWARVLTARGVVVDAYDDMSWQEGPSRQQEWYPVKKGGPKEVGKHAADSALLLVWPPYNESMGADAVESYLRAGGQKVAYVGEGWGGCNGDDRLFKLFETYFDEVKVLSIPVWPGIGDNAHFFVRK